MAYSEKLKSEVKQLYPNSKEIITCVENGSFWLGEYLLDNISVISNNEILNAKSLEDLQEKAKLIQKKQSVYNKWCEEDPRKFS